MTSEKAGPAACQGPTTFWNRDFLLSVIGYFFLYFSVSLFFLLPLFLEQFGPPRSRIGLIMGIQSVVAIAVRPFFGRLIDVRGGRRIALTGLLVLAVTLPPFHLVRDAGWLPILLRAVGGLGWGISMTASIAVCSDLAPAEKLAKSMGIIGVAGLVANALGPVAAEDIINRFGFGWLFNISLLALGAAALCLFGAREIVRPPDQKPGAATRALKSIPFVAGLVIAALPVFHGAVRGAVIYFIAVFARSVDIARVGPFFLVFSLSAILTRFGTGDLSDRYGRKTVILPAALIICGNLFLVSQVRSFGLLVATGFIGGLGQGLIFPALSTYIIDVLGRDNKGLAISLYLSLFDVGMGLGAPFFGWIADLEGYRMMYIFAGLFLMVSTIVFMIRAPRVGRKSTKEVRNVRGRQRPV
jgi:MFS family permease